MVETNPIELINVYNPVKNIQKEEFDFYLNQLTYPAVFLGDFNAHHLQWTTSVNANITGNNLADSMLNFQDIVLLTPLNFPTHFHVPTRKIYNIRFVLYFK